MRVETLGNMANSKEAGPAHVAKRPGGQKGNRNETPCSKIGISNLPKIYAEPLV
jgi:hypothetical protein